MIKKNTLKFLFPFIINIFITLIITILTSVFSIIIAIKLNILSADNHNPFLPILIIVLVSIAIATFFTTILGLMIHSYIAPIRDLVDATKKVSKGDFTIRLDKSYKDEEVNNMNIAFNKMVRELSSIETLRNDFIVNVSHEFKTPIATIEGYATLLQEPNISDNERLEYTTMILESSRQLSSLSGNILKLSKLETQEIVSDGNYFYLDEQLRQALLFLENNWSKKNIDIDMDLTTTYYYGNEDLLMQVWLNIFGNAIKFTPNNGTIATRLKSADDGIYVSISDTGIGMNDKVKERIFEKFFQGDSSRNLEGNGLGLTLVKRIIDLCGCSINVESEVNKGSTFTIFLPINNKSVDSL